MLRVRYRGMVHVACTQCRNRRQRHARSRACSALRATWHRRRVRRRYPRRRILRRIPARQSDPPHAGGGRAERRGGAALSARARRGRRTGGARLRRPADRHLRAGPERRGRRLRRRHAGDRAGAGAGLCFRRRAHDVGRRVGPADAALSRARRPGCGADGRAQRQWPFCSRRLCHHRIQRHHAGGAAGRVFHPWRRQPAVRPHPRLRRSACRRFAIGAGGGGGAARTGASDAAVGIVRAARCAAS